MIDVKTLSRDDPLEFEVTVTDERGESRHSVTMSQNDHARLSAGGQHAPERCLRAAFAFLLDREPKEAILSRFDVSVIPRYFPEFEDALPGYLDRV